MARRGARPVEIVHSSFIDLLFGAFGAFVMVMITYVVLTMNMTPQEIRAAINHYARQNKALAHKVKVLRGELEDKRRIEAELKRLEHEKQLLEQRLAQAELVRKSAEARAGEADEAGRRLRKEFGRLQNTLQGLEHRHAELQARYESLMEEKHTNEETGAAMEWLRYLSLLLLYIAGFELTQLLNRREVQEEERIFREHGATLVQDYERDEMYMQGGRNDTVKQINAVRVQYRKFRTTLWGAALFSAVVMVHRFSGGSAGWLAVGAMALFYFYLKKRFDLI